jgi:type I restriction enzyme M protein
MAGAAFILVRDGLIVLKTGDEIGRLAYGTGSIPFVRTSDLGTYELKTDPKHGINEIVWGQFGKAQNTEVGAILLVRDGTYLVGSSALVQEEDTPLLFCGGIYKMSFPRSEKLSPGLCYALFNLPIVHQQMRNKQFTRDVIDTLGHRIREVVLPVPKDQKVRSAVGKFLYDACQNRVKSRAQLAQRCHTLFGLPPTDSH